MDWIQLFMAGY